MQILEPARKALFIGGLCVVTLSFALDNYFATDAVSIPEPSLLSLLAVGGVMGIAVSLMRRRKK